MARFCSCWVATWGRFAATTKKRGNSYCVQYGTPGSGKIITFWPGVCASMETFFDIEVTSRSAGTHCWRTLRLSGHGRGTRQRIYILGCLGDLERQKQNYAAASEHLDRAIELARATFIPGWLGNLHLGLAELAFDRNRFDDAKILLEQSEAHYRNTHPRHWWGEIQVGLA